MLNHKAKLSFIVILLLGINVFIASSFEDRCWELDEEILPTDPRVQVATQITDLAINPVGDILAFSKNEVVYFYSTDTLEPLQPLTIPETLLAGHLAWSPDGSYIALGSDSVYIFDLSTGELIATFNESQHLLKILWSEDSRYLIGLAFSGLYVWDIEQAAQINILFEEVSPIQIEFDLSIQLALLSDNLIITQRNQLFVWDFLGTNPPDLVAEREEGQTFKTVTISPDLQYLATGNNINSSIEIWDTSTWEIETTLQPRPVGFRDMEWSSDGSILAISGEQVPGCTVAVWNIIPLSDTFEYVGINPGWVSNITWMPNYHILFAALNDGTVYKWDVQTEQLLGIIETDNISTEN
jgi:WD40 repeat protein